MMRFKLVVALFPVFGVVIAAVLLLGGGGHATVPGHRTFTPVRARASSPLADAVPSGGGALIALVVRPTEMRTAPGGRVLGAVGRRTQFGSPEILLVSRVSARWLGVINELAGNGRIGWIPRSAVVLGRNPYELQVSLSARWLTVLRDRRVVARYTVGIGAQDSPTPTGRFTVTDRLLTNDPQGPYGCCILALSATAPHAIPGWTGGNRIAIHATPDSETIGEPDSHGCIHVAQAEARWLIDNVPLGTPTVIAG